MHSNRYFAGRFSLLASLILSACLPGHALAYPVEVMSSVPIQTQVAPALGAINGTLTEISTTQHQVGAAINQNGGKVATQIEQAAQAQRDQDIFARQAEKLEQARRTYTIPDSICSESGSGVAAQVQSGARAHQGALASGGGISNNTIRQGVTAPPPPLEQAQFRTAAIHADYCDATDVAAYGGTALCKAISELPGGDKRLTSLLDGAGKDGKIPDLTFNQQQTDAALTSSPTFALRDSGGGFPLVGDGLIAQRSGSCC